MPEAEAAEVVAEPEPEPSNGVVVAVIDRGDGGLGLTLSGPTGELGDERVGIFVTKVKESSPCKGVVRAKSRIYSIDGVDVTSALKSVATNLIKAAGSVVKLVTSDGPDVDGYAAFKAAKGGAGGEGGAAAAAAASATEQAPAGAGTGTAAVPSSSQEAVAKPDGGVGGVGGGFGAAVAGWLASLEASLAAAARRHGGGAAAYLTGPVPVYSDFVAAHVLGVLCRSHPGAGAALATSHPALAMWHGAVCPDDPLPAPAAEMEATAVAAADTAADGDAPALAAPAGVSTGPGCTLHVQPAYGSASCTGLAPLLLLAAAGVPHAVEEDAGLAVVGAMAAALSPRLVLDDGSGTPATVTMPCAILRFLCCKYPQLSCFYSTQPATRAAIDSALDFIQANVAPHVAALAHPFLRGDGQLDHAQAEGAQASLGGGAGAGVLAAVATNLLGDGGTFIGGGTRVSIADIYLRSLLKCLEASMGQRWAVAIPDNLRRYARDVDSGCAAMNHGAARRLAHALSAVDRRVATYWAEHWLTRRDELKLAAERDPDLRAMTTRADVHRKIDSVRLAMAAVQPATDLYIRTVSAKAAGANAGGSVGEAAWEDTFSVLQFNVLAEGLSSGPLVAPPFDVPAGAKAWKASDFGGFDSVPNADCCLDFDLRKWRIVEEILRCVAKCWLPRRICAPFSRLLRNLATCSSPAHAR